MSNTALRRADRVGFAASFLCAVHCALLPVLLGVLPALGLNLGGWLDFDFAFVVFASILGLTTMSMGWRRHRAMYGWMTLLPGLALLWIGVFIHLHDSPVHAIMMTTGGLLLAGAHFINMRLTHAHTHACGCVPANPA